MKLSTKVYTAGLSLVAATLVMAQDGPPRGQQGGPGGGPGGGQMPKMPLVNALDADSDGEISAAEIANAAAALKKLDKNGDGKLTRDEFMGQRPGGPGGPGRQGNRPQDSTGN